MADLIIAAVSYSGSPINLANPQRPNSVERSIEKIGRTLRSANGTTTYIHRAIKRTWTIRWTKANQTTETALAAVRAIVVPFTFTDVNGTSYSVVNVDEDEFTEGITTNRLNAYLYDLELKLREV